MKGRVYPVLFTYPIVAVGIAGLLLGIGTHNAVFQRLGIGGFAVSCIVATRLCFTYLIPASAASGTMVQGAVKFAILSTWPLVGGVILITLVSIALLLI